MKNESDAELQLDDDDEIAGDFAEAAFADDVEDDDDLAPFVSGLPQFGNFFQKWPLLSAVACAQITREYGTSPRFDMTGV